MNNDTKINNYTNSKISTKDLVLTGMFTAILCVMAQIIIPIQPIPFTLSLFAIFLIGALLPPQYAFLSVFVYILLGAFGVPVFAGLKGGFAILFGKTGGYIMAYPFMSLITALFYKYFKKYKIAALVIGMLVSLIVCYLFGTLWFSIISGMDFITALTFCVVPYILFDIIKIILATGASTILHKTALR